MNNHGEIMVKESFVDKKDLKNTENTRINKNRNDNNHGKTK